MISLEKKKAIFNIANKELKKLYPNIKITLDYSSPFELLVAVILSAQTTDKKVNQITDNLFKKYKTVKDYANASVSKFAEDIYGVNYYKTKARAIIEDAKMIMNNFHGKMPDNYDDLMSLKGVARKTANVILSNIYNKNEGIVVDTHVKRLSKIIGLTENTDPEKIEQDLIKIAPENERKNFSMRLIQYGRDYCPARKHDHANCPLTLALK